MNNENQDKPNSDTGLIDRRFFLKKTTTAVAVVAAGSLIATSGLENQLPAGNNAETDPAATGDTTATNKQWKAGWMAF